MSWTLEQDALELQLIQRLPDQTRAFYQGRGFTPAIANALGEACIFQTIARNVLPPDSTAAVEVNLTNWRIHVQGKSAPVKLKEEWLQDWETGEATRAARIAFRWATFPTRQTFLPGDYNWGMISFGPLPGATFDLRVVWRQDNEEKSAWIYRIQCPEDN